MRNAIDTVVDAKSVLTLKGRLLKAHREFVTIDMKTLVRAGEVVLCLSSEVNELRSSERGQWFTLTLSRFGQQSPVELVIDTDYLRFLTIVEASHAV